MKKNVASKWTLPLERTQLTKPLRILAVALVLVITSCGRQYESASEQSVSYDNTAKADAYEEATEDLFAGPEGNGAEDAEAGIEEIVSSSAATNKNVDPARKFVRTADLKFKVKSVQSSTVAIEDIIAHFRGYVEYTNLRSTINSTQRTDVTADSTRLSTYFTVSNSMTLRVPNSELDTALKCIAKHIDYLDHRVITAEDVTYNELANSLNMARQRAHDDRLKKAADQRKGQLWDETTIERHRLAAQTQADQSLLDNLRLQDKVDLSTITLQLYQAQAVKTELVEKPEQVEAYKPGFWSKLGESFAIGWQFVEVLILLLTRCWSVLLLGLGLFFLIRMLVRKYSN